MKLSEWAKKRGITYKTAWRWVREGEMPVPFEITPTGTILVHEKRKELVKLLADPNVTTIVALHRDRLTRFGFARLYGKRSARRRAKKALEALQREDP